MNRGHLDSKASLTTRESEILELVAHGFSARTIAAKLQIAPRTVERHIDILRMKMRASNRVHMVTRAVITGHLQLGPPPAGPRLCTECLFQPAAPAAPGFAPDTD